MTIDELTEEVVQLAKEEDANFLQLAKLLRELHDTVIDGNPSEDPDAFLGCIKKAKIGKRKAYYLLEIDQIYGKMKVSKKQLSDVGWTKLSLLAKYVEQKSLDVWLAMAKKLTVEELKTFLAGKNPTPHTVTLKFNKVDYDMVIGTLLVAGAYFSSGGYIVNKEVAVLKVCDLARKSLPIIL